MYNKKILGFVALLLVQQYDIANAAPCAKVTNFVSDGFDVLHGRLPEILKIWDGGNTGTAFKFKDNWILTAAHNVNSCSVNFRGGKARCWIHPGSVDIAACHSTGLGSINPVELNFSGGNGSATSLYLVAGYGCAGQCQFVNALGFAASSLSAGILEFLRIGNSGQEVELKSQEGCTQVCDGDSGGPVYEIRKVNSGPGISKLDELELGKISGVIRWKEAPDPGQTYLKSGMVFFTSATERWLGELDEKKKTDCETVAPPIQ